VTLADVHLRRAEIGEVFANMLHVVYADLVAAKGFNPKKFDNPYDGTGNVVFMQILIDSLSILACNPNCELLSSSSLADPFLVLCFLVARSCLTLHPSISFEINPCRPLTDKNSWL